MAGIRQLEAWDAFVAWCMARGLKPLPANPWTVAAYLRAREHGSTPAGLARIVGAIGRLHREKSRYRPDRDPLVKRTLDRIETDARDRKARKDAKVSLFDDQDFTTDKPTESKPKKKTAAKKTKKRTAKKVSLRATPRLVRRRT